MRATFVFVIIAAALSVKGQEGCTPFGDLTGDSLVTVMDLTALLSVYGVDYTTQNPSGNCQPVQWYGYTYSVVEIGDQCWFAENLRTQVYQNGDSIVNDPDLCPNPNNTYCFNSASSWSETCSGCGMTTVPVQPNWWDTDEVLDMESIYGRMYNTAAARDPRKLCPVGWSIARDSDYEYVCSLYGDQSGTTIDDGLVLDGSGGWWFNDGTELPSCAQNLSGLGLRPGGFSDSGNFSAYNVGSTGTYWEHSVGYSNYEPGDRYMTGFRISYECSSCTGSSDGGDQPWKGRYVRCIKD